MAQTIKSRSRACCSRVVIMLVNRVVIMLVNRVVIMLVDRVVMCSHQVEQAEG